MELKIIEKNFKFTFENFNGKLTFSNVLSNPLGHMSFSTRLENNTIFDNNFFSSGEEASPFLPLTGVPDLNKFIKRIFIANFSIELYLLVKTSKTKNIRKWEAFVWDPPFFFAVFQ